MNYKTHGQMSESILTAAFLSISGGLQDAYTYLFRGKVFANAQTGNIVLLSQNIMERNWHLVIHYMIPLVSFAIGIVAAEIIRTKFQRVQQIHWRQLVLIIEIFLLLFVGFILLLFMVGFIPYSLNMAATTLVSFSCAMQVQTFRKVNGYAFASTMCIGNIRSGMESLCVFGRTRDKHILFKSLCYFAIIVMFAFGAGLGSGLISTFKFYTIWFSSILLFVSFLFMFIKEETSPRM